MPDLPTGTVTFLFTDVEGSTGLVQRLGDGYAPALDEQRRMLREAVEESGHEVDCRGEEFLFAFTRTKEAAMTAVAAQRALQESQLRVRMGIHTGEPTVRDDGYLGLDVHRGARICAAGHGGQMLLSQTTYDLLVGFEPEGVELTDLGEHRLTGLPRAERIYQIVVAGLPSRFPPLRAQPERSAFLGRERELARSALGIVSPSRLGRATGALRTRQRGLADLGWEVRSLLPAVPPGAREEVAGLGGDLFAAARAAVDVDRYLDGLDRKGMARRLAEYRELGVVSRNAAREAESYARQLADIDRLAADRQGLDRLGDELEGSVATLRSDSEPRTAAAALRKRVRTATAELDADLVRARSDLGVMSVRLRRTRHRGVYRRGERFVVPYFDEVGVESRREFESIEEALAFRATVRLQEETLGLELDPSPFRVWDQEGGAL